MQTAEGKILFDWQEKLIKDLGRPAETDNSPPQNQPVPPALQTKVEPVATDGTFSVQFSQAIFVPPILTETQKSQKRRALGEKYRLQDIASFYLKSN